MSPFNTSSEFPSLFNVLTPSQLKHRYQLTQINKTVTEEKVFIQCHIIAPTSYVLSLQRHLRDRNVTMPLCPLRRQRHLQDRSATTRPSSGHELRVLGLSEVVRAGKGSEAVVEGGDEGEKQHEQRHHAKGERLMEESEG